MTDVAKQTRAEARIETDSRQGRDETVCQARSRIAAGKLLHR
jgi:hypothetical protein